MAEVENAPKDKFVVKRKRDRASSVSSSNSDRSETGRPSTGGKIRCENEPSKCSLPSLQGDSKKQKVFDSTPGSESHQRLTWKELSKNLQVCMESLARDNLLDCLPTIFSYNLVRGRGLLVAAIMAAQEKQSVKSGKQDQVYAAFVSVINTKLPKVGELLVKRVLHSFRKRFKAGDAAGTFRIAHFLAQLTNQQVAHELLLIQLSTFLLNTPISEFSCSIAVSMLSACGCTLLSTSPEALRGLLDKLRTVLQDGVVGKECRDEIQKLLDMRKNNFKDFPALENGLDLVEMDDRVSHLVHLNDKIDTEDALNKFAVDPHFLEHEQAWKDIRNSILGLTEQDSGDEGDSETSAESDSSSDEDSDPNCIDQDVDTVTKSSDIALTAITDLTETGLVDLRRKIYLVIMSSLDFEECAHKLLSLHIPKSQHIEICTMLIECCSQERTYVKMYGLLGCRFCELQQSFKDRFNICFVQQYTTCHHLDTNKLRNCANFFAHLISHDALPWNVLSCVKMSENSTTSSGRIFVKVLFQEITSFCGIEKVKAILNDPILQRQLEGLFPINDLGHLRFSINFFTVIGLGVLTAGMREALKTMTARVKQEAVRSKTKLLSGDPTHSKSEPSTFSSSCSSDSDSSSSTSSTSTSGTNSSTSSSSSEEEENGDERKRFSKSGDLDKTPTPDANFKALFHRKNSLLNKPSWMTDEQFLYAKHKETTVSAEVRDDQFLSPKRKESAVSAEVDTFLDSVLT
jgi:pre-mRNA-splicing factor CWC22